ncbi:hypothetical protein CONPUDRAFT_76200 [Coniophora puteana RWD-64-598 SS2]|uniref:Uncharacterized protein n=1 Tax=Coniophora puteana (strain RWD-64-598) TaxID=741705 RepID=A0A5M3MBD9_CONPW|nr:uncharacterized protein CONPUDRAFT_76200 [Coniophora puteana RWD-64-598 SS2]EIW76559.1 hypothetical protein CONPUDRAFT_76200 [Coniophora puteana RWD-64-598 SS2]
MGRPKIHKSEEEKKSAQRLWNSNYYAKNRQEINSNARMKRKAQRKNTSLTAQGEDGIKRQSHMNRRWRAKCLQKPATESYHHMSPTAVSSPVTPTSSRRWDTWSSPTWPSSPSPSPEKSLSAYQSSCPNTRASPTPTSNLSGNLGSMTESFALSSAGEISARLLSLFGGDITGRLDDLCLGFIEARSDAIREHLRDEVFGVHSGLAVLMGAAVEYRCHASIPENVRVQAQVYRIAEVNRAVEDVLGTMAFEDALALASMRNEGRLLYQTRRIEFGFICKPLFYSHTLLSSQPNFNATGTPSGRRVKPNKDNLKFRDSGRQIAEARGRDIITTPSSLSLKLEGSNNSLTNRIQPVVLVQCLLRPLPFSRVKMHPCVDAHMRLFNNDYESLFLKGIHAAGTSVVLLSTLTMQPLDLPFDSPYHWRDPSIEELTAMLQQDRERLKLRLRIDDYSA